MSKKFSFKEKLNLSQSCSLFVAMLVLMTGLVLSFLSWSNLDKQFHTANLQGAQQQLQRLTITIAPSLLLQDRVSININLHEWLKASELNFIRVLNSNRQVIAEAGRHATNSLEISQSITQDNLAIGTIVGEVNFHETNTIVRRHLALGLTITAFFTLLSVLVSYFLCERYFNYIRQLADQLNLWGANKSQPLELPLPPKLPELNSIHQGLHNLFEQQQQQLDCNDTIGLFGLTEPIAPHSLQYHTCALLFIQIENLKHLQTALSASELSTLLNRYYQLLQQAAKLYGGRLERYAGNGVVVLFGLQSQHSATAAMHSLYAAQLFLGIIEQQHQQTDAQFVDFRLACHWGDVLLPTAASEGSQSHYELTSDSVQLAARLAHASEHSRLLISQALYEQISDNKQASWLQGNELSDLYGHNQATWRLEQLEQKQKSLIERQIKHITSFS